VFRYCDGGWKYSAAALRQELIDISAHWKDLWLPDECPYQPTPEDLAEHKKQFEDFEARHNMILACEGLVGSNSEGWVPVEDWEMAKDRYKEVYEMWMEAGREEKEEEKARLLWPFPPDNEQDVV